MKKYITILLLPVFGLFVFSGCATLRNLSAQNITDARGERVLVAYGSPEKSWNCKKKGYETAKTDRIIILGIPIGDSLKEADKKARRKLIPKSVKYKANYVDYSGPGETFIIVYGWGTDADASYYNCKKLPPKKK